MSSDPSSVVRRHFIKDSGLMIAGSAIGGAMAARRAVAGDRGKPIRVAFVGCGRRGRELAGAVLGQSNAPVRLVGLADAYPSQVQSMYRFLNGRFKDQIDRDCVRAAGLNAYQTVCSGNADLIYLATPPVDRPLQFSAAIEADKHVFLEKPLAADVEGIASVLKTNQLAKSKGLSVFVGFQRRYDARYLEVVNAIHDGLIGRPIFAKAICNAGPIRKPLPTGKESAAEYERRNWNHFQWTGGDFLIEQHVAGLDVIRWALQDTPSVAQGQGGWGLTDDRGNETSVDPAGELASRQLSGEVFDHHSVEYEFSKGAVLLSQCRRVAKAWNNTGEQIHGTKGRADLTAGKIYAGDGELIWQSKEPMSLKTATATQQSLLLEAIAGGHIVNEVDSAAESTLVAMLGHAATRSRKRVRWDRFVKPALG
jgi:predicted dehydrogenase